MTVCVCVCDCVCVCVTVCGSQVELLEAILLYYKDFVHRSHDLINHAHCLHGCGFGLRQNSRVSLVEGAGLLQQHIG